MKRNALLLIGGCILLLVFLAEQFELRSLVGGDVESSSTHLHDPSHGGVTEGSSEEDTTALDKVCAEHSDLFACTIWHECKKMLGHMCDASQVLELTCQTERSISREIARCKSDTEETCKKKRKTCFMSATSDAKKIVAKACEKRDVQGCGSTCRNAQHCENASVLLRHVCALDKYKSKCEPFLVMCQGFLHSWNSETGAFLSSMSGFPCGDWTQQENSHSHENMGQHTGEMNHMDHAGMMTMSFHGGISDPVLFAWLVPSGTVQYLCVCVMIVLSGLTSTVLKAYRSEREREWTLQPLFLPQQHSGASVFGSLTMMWALMHGGFIGGVSDTQRQVLFRNLTRATMTGVITCIDYMLMLIAMTFNTGYFVAVMLAFITSQLLYGHWFHSDLKIQS